MFKATFRDLLGNKPTRCIVAKHINQANIIAGKLAKKHGWTVVDVGSV